MSGARTENTRANGKTTRCTATERPNGLMEENTKVNTSMTKSMELELSIGQMEESMSVLGRTANSTEEESIILFPDKSVWENGCKERE
jgi:hypothetical protein